ncbi:MAG: hypothetical protein NTY74_01190 [Ignavibacteriae bacterium]|nr:hypothetical protein [Ignavibacteriota bacterium]
MKVPEFFYNIKYLSDIDMEAFEKFLQSPYFNTTTSLPVVFGIIKDNVRLIRENRFDELKTVIVKTSEYSEGTVGKNLSYLNNMYEEFAKAEGVKNKKFYNEFFRCKYLLLKGNYHLLNKEMDNFDRILNEQENFDNDLFLNLYDFNMLKYAATSTSDNKLDTLSKLDREKEFTLESSKNLIIYTLAKTTINFASYVIQCSNSTKKADKKYPVNLESIFSITKSPEFNTYNTLQKKTITINHKLYRMYSSLTTDRYYKDYRDYYYKVKDSFNHEFRNTHLGMLMNYCFLRYRVKDIDKHFLAEGHRILYDFIDGRYYITDNTEYLHSTIYRNYVVYCATKDRKEMLKKFIDNHTDKLNPAEEKMMKDFAMAHYCYASGQNELSLKHTEKLNNAKFFYKFDLIFLKIKLFYEMQDFVSLENMLHILKHNLQTAEIFNANEVKKFEYLIYCLNLLIKAHTKYEKTEDIFDFEFVLKKIDAKPSFAIRNWLREKVTEFIKENKK